MARTTALLALLLVLSACGNDAGERDFAVLPAPRADIILVTTVTPPVLPFGPHRVTVYVQVGRQAVRQRLGAATLASDGVPFTPQQIGMRWVADDEALICLRATDRPDQSFHVKVEGEQATARLAPGC